MTPTNEQDAARLELLRGRKELQFLTKHFYGAVFNPLPKQRDFLESRAKIAVLSGGNRSGKTECGAVWASLMANGILGLVYPESGFPSDGRPTRGIVSGLDYKMVSKVLKPKILKALGSSLHSWRERDQKATTKNGSEIWFMSEESGEQKYQAIDIDWALKDEFGDLKAEGVVNEILRGLVDRNGVLRVCATPTLGASWAGPLWYEPWRDATGEVDGQMHVCPDPGHCSANGVTFFFMDMEDNFYLSAAAKADWVARQVTEEQKQVRLKGRFVTLEGLVYPMFHPDTHVIDSQPIPDEWAKWRGMDWGLSAPSTCLWAAVEPGTDDLPPRLHIYRELYDTRQGKTIQMTASAINDMSGEEDFVQTVLDPACWNRDPAPEAVGGFFVVADEFARHDIYAEKANNSVEPSVERLWGYMSGDRPQLVIHRCCENLIRELRRQRWKKGITGLTSAAGMAMSDKIEKRDPDHAIDALRYIVMAGPLEDNFYSWPDEDPFDSRVDDGHTYGMDWEMDGDGNLRLVPARF